MLRKNSYKQVVIERLGGPETLRLVSRNMMEPASGECLIRVLTAGVSYADMLMREGVHPETPALPFTPGWDIVGVVEKNGTGTSHIRPGTMVAALPIIGGYSEFICVPECELIPVPDHLCPSEVVCLILNYTTAYQMLYRVARVKKGQKILIHAATGGVGSALLELGHLAGLNIIATASSNGHDLISKYGGIPIDYRSCKFVDFITAMEDPGVDFVFDGIGGSHLWQSYRVLRQGGSVIAYGFTSALENVQPVRKKNNRFKYLFNYLSTLTSAKLLPDGKGMKPYSIQNLKRLNPNWFRKDLKTLINFLQDGMIHPVIAEELPLEMAAQAHWMLARGVQGKIVLRCNGGKNNENHKR